ncbi:MAG: hypothetical protein WA688_01805 [Thermoplasmata archaeon]
MAFSHRDHRARRELRQLYLGFGASVGALAFVAVLFPNETVRLFAVGGLAAAGAAYVLSADRLSDRYRRDLMTVRAGEPISGSVRAEVYDEVGFERDREDDWLPSPHHRHPVVAPEAPRPGPSAGVAPSTSPARSDPPSNGS